MFVDKYTSVAACREVIFLSDQTFPPCVPAEDGGKCLLVVRIENGSLRELTSELRDFSRKIKIAPGSTILIGSISHLAGAGVAGYSEELVAVRALIKQEIGQNIHVGPLPLMLPCWTMDSALIRAMVELNSWL